MKISVTQKISAESLIYKTDHKEEGKSREQKHLENERDKLIKIDKQKTELHPRGLHSEHLYPLSPLTSTAFFFMFEMGSYSTADHTGLTLVIHLPQPPWAGITE